MASGKETISKKEHRKQLARERLEIINDCERRLKNARFTDESCKLVRDLVKDLGSLRFYSRNGRNLEFLFFARGSTEVSNVPVEVLNFCLELTEKNMKQMYEQSSWGWNRLKKKREIEDEEARLILIRDNENGAFVGFGHFRFERMDNDVVLYLYELQLEASITRQKLGKQLMVVLELIARNLEMDKVILTVFLSNIGARKFYERLNYSIDETSPEGQNGEDYTILSKLTRRRIKQATRIE